MIRISEGHLWVAGPHYGENCRAMAVGSTTTRAGEAALERLRQWPGEHRVAAGLLGGATP